MPEPLGPHLGAALDRYQSDVARRVGISSARELRRELEAHLVADVAARISEGVASEIAQAEALGALGDLRLVARAERPPHWRLGRILLFAAPTLSSLAWSLPHWMILRNGALPEWVPTALALAFFVATPSGTVLVRRPAFGTILLGAIAHGLLTGGGMVAARGSTRQPVLLYILRDSLAMTLFGFVATLALHLVAHLLIFGIPALRDRTSGVSRA